MKKITLCACAALMFHAAGAQFDASQLTLGVAANYSAYKGEFQEKTYGPKINAAYSFTEKLTTNLSYTMGLPIHQPSRVQLVDNNGNSISAASEIIYKFHTVQLTANYHLAGSNLTRASLYGIVGAGYVSVAYHEEIREAYDKNMYTPWDQQEKSRESGLTLNLGIGGQVQLGYPFLFAEAGIGLPSNQVGGTYVENNIPAHYQLNLGLRIPLAFAE